jgi:Holliday junction DNA helicase RuvA
MIAYLKGILLKKTTGRLIIDNGGIGYEVIVPLSTFYALPDEEEQVGLHIYTHVKEDAFILFGFKTVLEKDIFRMLISVSGIGPKLAVNILSGVGPDVLLEAISTGDVGRLQAIPGVGKKTAERISLELKDKAQEVGIDLHLPKPTFTVVQDRTVFDDALSALVYLGYSVKPAKKAVENAISNLDEVTLEEVIKEALRLLV